MAEWERVGDEQGLQLDLVVASLATLAHDLRTPLTPILGYLEALLAGETGPLTDEQQRALEIVQRNAKRLARVASEISFLAESEGKGDRNDD